MLIEGTLIQTPVNASKYVQMSVTFKVCRGEALKPVQQVKYLFTACRSVKVLSREYTRLYTSVCAVCVNKKEFIFYLLLFYMGIIYTQNSARNVVIKNTARKNVHRMLKEKKHHTNVTFNKVAPTTFSLRKGTHMASLAGPCSRAPRQHSEGVKT